MAAIIGDDNANVTIPNMPKRHFESWLRAFVDYASYGEAPLPMLYWTGVSTIAGVLRRRVWIDMKYFQWVPNFYIVMVAPPGIVSKSTTANIGMNLLRKVPGIKFGPDVVTWQALVQSLSASTELAHWPERQEYIPMSALTIASDEFGTFLNPNDREMVDVLVSLWDGKRGVFSKITKMSGNDSIENPWINIIACTTPEWISGNFPRYMIGGGFTSRCVFIYTDEKRQTVAYPDEYVPPGFEDMQLKLIHDLECISMIIGDYTIDPAAREWGRDWYERHWKSPPPDLRMDEFGGYLARKQTHMHKLAIVHAASESDERVIRLHHLEGAFRVVSALEGDMPRVFARIGQTEITRASTDIVSFVNRAGTISEQELFRHFFRNLSWKEFSEALNSAHLAGHIKRMQEGEFIMIRKGTK